MIRQLDNGTKVIVLGEGTTTIGQVVVSGDTMSSGVFFSAKKPIEGKIDSESVIIEIRNLQGAMSYMKAVIDLLQTWEIEGTETQLKELNESISLLLQKQNK